MANNLCFTKQYRQRFINICIVSGNTDIMTTIICLSRHKNVSSITISKDRFFTPKHFSVGYLFYVHFTVFQGGHYIGTLGRPASEKWIGKHQLCLIGIMDRRESFYSHICCYWKSLRVSITIYKGIMCLISQLISSLCINYLPIGH